MGMILKVVSNSVKDCEHDQRTKNKNNLAVTEQLLFVEALYSWFLLQTVGLLAGGEKMANLIGMSQEGKVSVNYFCNLTNS